jgi:pimeloyl-ACP methyl ester carboxylesterase
MPKIRVSKDLEINYEIYDFTDPWKKTDTIILAHGNYQNLRQWYAWIPRLSREYKVLAFDARGKGGSTVPPKGYKCSLEQFSQDVNLLLDALNLDKVFYVGNSFGGIIGIQFAYDHPERLKALILCSTPYRFPKSHVEKAKRIEKIGLKNFLVEDGKRKFNVDQVDPGFLEWKAAESAKTPEHVAISSIYFAATIDLGNILPKIKVPTLILAPDGSDRSPIEDAKYMSEQIPNAKLVLFRGCAHSISQQIPDRCIDEVLKFI